MSTNAVSMNPRKSWLLSLDSWAVVAALLAALLTCGLAYPRGRFHAHTLVGL